MTVAPLALKGRKGRRKVRRETLPGKAFPQPFGEVKLEVSEVKRG